MARKSPLERRQEQIGTAGRYSELKTARRLSARLTANSGAGKVKGDFYLPDFHFEAKATEAKSISLKLDWLLKLVKTARDYARVPALTVTFITGDGRHKAGGAWVLIPEADFHALIHSAATRQPDPEATASADQDD